MMNAIELLSTRRSVLARQLHEPGPDAETLRDILRIGLRVPDHGKIEPWRIQVLDEEARTQLGGRIAQVYAREHPEADDDAVAAERVKHVYGPTMLVVSCHPNPDKFAKVPLIEQQLSCGAVCLNLLSAATAHGFGAQWITGWPAYHPDVKRALGIEEAAYLIGFVHIGSRAEPPKERPRPDLARVVRYLEDGLDETSPRE